jgi:hypothetical protein
MRTNVDRYFALPFRLNETAIGWTSRLSVGVCSIFSQRDSRVSFRGQTTACRVVARMLIVLSTLFATDWHAHAASPSSSSEAVSLLASAEAALSGSTAISDVTLTGSAGYTAGSDEETGTVTLKAKGGLESSLSLSLSSGPRIETRQNQSGQWSGSDGQAHQMSWHNCLTPSRRARCRSNRRWPGGAARCVGGSWSSYYAGAFPEFSSMMRNLRVDANNVCPSTGILIESANEGSGLDNVGIDDTCLEHAVLFPGPEDQNFTWHQVMPNGGPAMQPPGQSWFTANVTPTGLANTTISSPFTSPPSMPEISTCMPVERPCGKVVLTSATPAP